MGVLSFVLMFVTAHLVAWWVLGGGWRGAARAPFAVFVPATAVLLLDGLFNETSGTETVARIATLLSWEAAYFFLYLILRLVRRMVEPAQLAGPRR
jgi:hypothetical protein